jgi:RimJ/RimL family protein N-acetyltransferase
MESDALGFNVTDWRLELPVLSSPNLLLREPRVQDVAALIDLLSTSDATSFGMKHAVTESSVTALIERAQRERAAGVSFTYVIAIGQTGSVVGLVQVRQLDPAFEAGEWEVTLLPSVRGTGVFIESARLVGTFAFSDVGAHRLESRVLLHNGRANGALRKLGAVQEGVLRRSVRRQGQFFDQVLWALVKDDWGDRWVAKPPRVH